ncbi:NUDIX domain-containing protein [Streptomyces sp. NPDC127117]|uniref:NUDIX domain-containing protein n=1 Tax=Streptomyces sp. NPDC127117 TaxID=3345368 RepID=UPI003624F4CA
MPCSAANPPSASRGVDEGESLTEALRREVAEETGLPVAAVVDYLGHFDHRSGSGRATRRFNFTATVTEADETVKLTGMRCTASRPERPEPTVTSA